MYPVLTTLLANADTTNSDQEPQPKTEMSISIELAEKMLIKFDGTKSKLYEFIDNCEKAYSLVKTEHKPILFAIIETKLTDNARAIVRNRSFDDWASLKNHLLDIYSEKRTIGQWQLELNSCRQNHNEDVVSFANKVEDCYIKLINSVDSNLSKEARTACIQLLKNEALSVFLTGLNKDLSLIVKSQKPDSLEKAISLALTEEQEQKSKLEIHKYQNVNNSFAKLCNFCNKPGHTTFNCRFRQNQKSTQQIKNIQSSNSYPNRQGNLNSSKFCNYCKRNGHIIQECRKREYNNKNRNQTNFQSSNTRNSNTNSQSPNPSNSNTSSHLNSERSRPNTAGTRTANTIQAESLQ